MLTVALLRCEPATQMMASTVLVLEMKSGKQLQYIDQKIMGQIYYISSDQSSEIVRFENPRSHVIDESLSLYEFSCELKSFGGEAKGCSRLENSSPRLGTCMPTQSSIT